MTILAIIPTHTVATWLLNTIDGMLNHLGLNHFKHLEEAIYILIISIVSVSIGILLKKLILLITRKVVVAGKNEIATELHNHLVFIKCSHIIPPLVFMAMVPFAFKSGSIQLHWILKIVGIYALIAFAVGVNSILKFVFDRYNERKNQKNLPLKGVLDVATGTVWIIIVILAISIVVEKSPATLLAGLGAFAAALMLIFKDSILGFVAGIQMNDNDMVHVGDWIVVPGTPANGNVIDVSLSTVKILNWDMTTVMVPPYTLVSTSFQNYRSMYDLGARRIENSVMIDMNSVHPILPEDVDNVVAKYPLLKTFVTGLRNNGRTAAYNQGARAMNGSLETNLGLYRAYVGLYLGAHEKIAQDQRIMVRVMQGSDTGIPLQIWCFTATTNWDEYEGIQSEIMEHLAAVVNDFNGLAMYSGTTLDVANVDAQTAPQK